MNDNYYNLELTILSCVLQKPELMKKSILDDKYFIKYKKLWIFMKSIYNKFGTFDCELMVSISNNQYKIMDYIKLLIDKEPVPSNFEKYQKQLIELYNQTKKEKYIIEEIYKIANELYVRNFSLEEFDFEYHRILRNANNLYKGDDINEETKETL